jgi:EAL domain-containing protein (putative c-di-GMP-specific phosphodiesterase class I)
MLVFDGSGRVAAHRPARDRSLPLNQRFARMWEIPEDALEHMRVENDLHRALEHGEFEVFLQPQASVTTNAIAGAEALARWRHPDRGLIFPDDFIPLAEQFGLIVQLDQQILRAACREARFQQQHGLPGFRVAVNMSAPQFQRTDLVDLVRGVLEETGLAPGSLELEITESTAMQHAAFALEVLRGLTSLGVRIALDDFGTGYSSLQYLKDFPIDTLKIDRSFLAGVPQRPNDEAIVGAVIAIGHSLGLEVVAEGVETEAQIALLRSRQCDWYQGHLLSEALPAEEFHALLARRAA